MSQDIDRTLWAGNLSEKVSEEILYELFLQAGPLEKVKIATERDGRQKSFAFITFSHDASVPYTIQLMDGMLLYGKNLKLQARPGSVHLQPQQPSFMNTIPANSQNPPGSPLGNPYMNNIPMQMNMNPYMMNTPGRSQGGPSSTPPQFHRSNTWHGNDMSGQQDRDQRDRGRDRDRERYSNNRDRSGRRDDYSRDRNRNGSNYHDDRSEDFESKRQRVLQKQHEVVNRYKQGQHHWSSPQHSPHYQYSNRRGRY